MDPRSTMRSRIGEIVKNVRTDASQRSLASKAIKLTSTALEEWGVYTPAPRSGGLALESISSVDFKMNSNFDAADIDVEKLVRALDTDMNIPSHNLAYVAEECLSIFDGTRNIGSILRDTASNGSESYIPLSTIVGPSSISGYASENFGFDSAAREAFGQDLDRLSTDDRLTMALTIMRPYENIMDKNLARVPQASPEVTIRIPAPEVYDWAATQASGSTATSRWSANTYPLRDLYRNPTPVNTNNKPVVLLQANDSKGVLFDNTTTKYCKTGVDISLLDLSRTSSTPSYATVDRTDTIAEGGVVDNLIITVTATVASVAKTERFLIPTRAMANAPFVMSPNGVAAQRQAIFPVAFMISNTTTQYDGSASAIAGALTDAKIRVNVRANGILNLQTGIMQLSGSADLELLPLASGASISGTTTTMFGTAGVTLSGYSAALYFNEENQRKANLAVFMQYQQKVFVVPRSRVIFTEYALTQDIDDNAVAATSSLLALGNGRRGLETIVNSINDIAAGQAFAAANPELVSINKVDEQSLASSLVKPFTVTSTLDFATTTINTMNESTRLSEMHGYFRARLLTAASNMFTKSLMTNQYKAGEAPVLKVWAHSSVFDIVVGIKDYHPGLDDTTRAATGADYSFMLPNGIRVDVVKSSWDCLQNRIYAVPVIESDMAGVCTAASIRDCGTITTNYSPTNAGAVVRRIATTTREIVMVSNRTGIAMEIKGFQTQLGAVGNTAIALNADSSNALS